MAFSSSTQNVRTFCDAAFRDNLMIHLVKFVKERKDVHTDLFSVPGEIQFLVQGEAFGFLHKQSGLFCGTALHSIYAEFRKCA